MSEKFRKAQFWLKRNALYITLYLLLFTSFALLIPEAGFKDDVWCWAGWSGYMLDWGFGNMYQLERLNYNPLYLYFLGFYVKLAGTYANITHYIHYLKFLTLPFDFIGAIVAASLVKKRQRRFLLSLLLLFNGAYLYNTLAWEQVDAIYTCFAFIAIILALRGYPVWSCLFYVLALNAKAQAIIFLPAMLLVLLPNWRRQPKTFTLSAITSAALQFVILIPFIWGGSKNYLKQIAYINVHTVDFNKVVSMNAYNLWFLIFNKKSLMTMPDTFLFAGLSYKAWGLLLFFIFSGIVLFPLFMLCLKNFLTREFFKPKQYGLVLLSCGLIPVVFSYFNTQMHERYWHAAILFLAAYGFFSKDYLLYIIASVAYFLNLEAVLLFMKLKNHDAFIFSPQFVAGLFTIVLAAGIYKIYRQATLKQYFLDIKHALKPQVAVEKVLNLTSPCFLF